MTDHNSSSPGDEARRDQAHQELAAALDEHRRAAAAAAAQDIRPASVPARLGAWLTDRLGSVRRVPLGHWLGRLARLRFNPWFLLDRRHPVVRRLTIAAIAIVVVVLAGSGALWWRLSSGPISLDLATPWLTAAIEENLGGRYHIQVGGTQIERDAQGHTAVRLRDIAVRDANGALVAVAPKAEVGLSGTSLLTARPRAASFRLVDASVLVRIGADGHINVFAGAERPLFSIAPVPTPPQPAPDAFSLQSMAERSTAANLLAMLAWVGGLGRDAKADAVTGFDGRDLIEIGILNGNLTIDNQRSRQQWKYTEVNLLLLRPLAGGAALSLGSSLASQPWMFNVAITPGDRGHRRLQLQTHKVRLDDLLALRMTDSRLRCDSLVSAEIEAEIAADGTPQLVRGTILAEGGSIHQIGHVDNAVPITSLEVALDWDIARQTLRVPFKISSGPTHLTLRSEFVAPTAGSTEWKFALGGGWIVLDPLTPNDEGLVLKRINVRGAINPDSQRVSLEQADVGTSELGGRDTKDVSIALSGDIFYGAAPRLALGVVGNQMTVSSLKRVWPVFIAPKVRDWILQHVASGIITKIEIAANGPLTMVDPDGPPLVEQNLLVAIESTATVLQPVAGLPAIRGADLNARITGRTATVALSKGTVEVSPGRRLSISNGVFEVADMWHPQPESQVRFLIEGPVPAAAELLALERLRDFSGTPFDPVTSRGTVQAQVQLAMPLRRDLPRGSTQYNISVDIANFAADKMLFGQKVEAAMLHVIAANQGYQIKGDVRVNGTPAQVDYRKVRTEPDAEFRLQATLDEATRARFGLNLGPAAKGPMPVKFTGRVGEADTESRFEVEADLTPMTIEGLLPGWGKPSGKPARAVFTLLKDKKSFRINDLLIDGQGVLIKGNVEFDAKGELELANFPVFSTADGDKAAVRAERGSDGVLRVVVRGDVYDGRNFIKSSMAGPHDPKANTRVSDLDLDVKFGVVAGHHGEAIRGVDLHLSRRAGRIRSFTLNATIGRDAPLLGEFRRRVSNGRQVLYFETNDAGALFRFTDVYPRMTGGQVWIGMDPPGPDHAPQEGVLQVRDFVIRGESTLDRVVAGAPDAPRNNAVEFTLARAEFTRTPGRMTIRDGIVNGPMIGATIDGSIDYARDDVNMRGTLVPLYGLNNMFGQIPIVGLFLGGNKEGLLGLTYEVRGPTANPRPVINPLSMIAPGLLRKVFEFRDPNTASSFAEPPR